MYSDKGLQGRSIREQHLHSPKAVTEQQHQVVGVGYCSVGHLERFCVTPQETSEFTSVYAANFGPFTQFVFKAWVIRLSV